ncbi:MAG: TIGR03960 family B12-binding radical SAM protein [Tissierellia bacterium]|nr:TIGR03960 family B12-binding radical SAM protein [Tissierellia bacterium]
MDHLEQCLKKVEKPARYIGGEWNTVAKDHSAVDLSFLFCFPDVYEVGMSHLGLQILYYLTNERPEYLLERAFAPWPDMEAQMREKGIALYGLESKTEAKAFDVIGFTLQYEMSYTNVLNMLDLAGLEVRSENRGESDPIIVAGGPCATTPEPMAPFVDLFIIGEGEEVNLKLMDLISRGKKEGRSKGEILLEAAKLDGIYVPSFYEVSYNDDGTLKSFRPKVEGAREKIKRVRVEDMGDYFSHSKLIVPYLETVHDRVATELFRGCTQGCRFCQAGMMYRPVRERKVADIVDQIDHMVRETGYSEVSLSSLSSCDYRDLRPLVDELVGRYEKDNVSISLPSLRLDTFMLDILKDIQRVRKSGLTFAPEAGSQRMRDVINKNVTEEDLLNVARGVFKEGYSRMKLYFMIGLPGETMEDVMGIHKLAQKVKAEFFNRPKEEIKGNFHLTASASCFVPKAFTPFQWVAQDSVEEFTEKARALKDAFRDPKVKFAYHEPEVSRMEAILARGDRRVAEVIERAWRKGQTFDGWSEYFSMAKWEEALREEGLDGDFYANRERPFEELLPWDMMDIGVSKNYLWREYQKSLAAETTKDCRLGCNGCGIENCSMWREFHEAQG